MLVEFNVVYHKTKNETVKRRDWRNYSKEVLNEKLSSMDWNINIDNVQEFWNVFENNLIRVVGEIVPFTDFVSNLVKSKIPKNIKTK